MPAIGAIYVGQKPTQLSAIATTFTLFKRSSDSTAPVTVYLPGDDRAHGKSFHVHASGIVTGNVTTNATITLQYGTSATTSSNTTIEASTARAVNSTTRNWSIDAFITVDDTSGVMNGYGRSMIGNLADADAVLDNAPTSVDTDINGNGFVVGVTFSVSDASNTADLLDFYIEPA